MTKDADRDFVENQESGVGTRAGRGVPLAQRPSSECSTDRGTEPQSHARWGWLDNGSHTLARDARALTRYLYAHS